MKGYLRLPLARRPAPIQLLPRVSARVGREIYLWRDDLNGGVEAGNKLRKLEFLLGEAQQQQATEIICAGGMHSNCTRAVTFCARRLGLKISIVMRSPKNGADTNQPPTGNFLLNRIAGARLYRFSYAEYLAAGGTYAPFLEAAADDARRRGERPYLIVAGGSQPAGCLGYVAAMEELAASWPQTVGTPWPDAIVTATCTGGTHAGLYLGARRQGFPTEHLWAVNVSDTAAHFHPHTAQLIDSAASAFGLEGMAGPLQLLDGHTGLGYGVATDAELADYAALAREEGVLLEPTYTGKAFRGLMAELKKNPDRFGQKILFLHSGGVFGNFIFGEQYERALAGAETTG